MSVHLQRDLEHLKKRLLTIGALVEEAVWKAMAALLDRKPGPAAEVIAGDLQVDRLEVETEEDCLKILALHQPVAKDLRLVAAVLKINNDLERVGDMAVNIAKRARFLAEQDAVAVPPELESMSRASRKMLRQSLDCFVREDVDTARLVCRDDEVVDELDLVVHDRLRRLIGGDPAAVERAFALLNTSRNLERIADHATNIAEDVIYLVDGEIVRHPGLAGTGGA